VVVIDEAGKMELASAAFRGAVQRLFDTGCSLVGTVHTHLHPFSDALKRRIQVGPARRRHPDLLPMQLADRFAADPATG